MYRKENILWPEGKPPSEAYCDEERRLAILAAHGTDAMIDDPELQEIVDLAAKVCDVPMVMVTMVEEGRQMFLARTGIEARETPRSTSFCAHAMLGTEPMVIRDAKEDIRFADNPLVTGEPHIRFYAGQPLISAEGAALGALCLIDSEPHEDGLSQLQQNTLSVLAKATMRRISQQRLGDAAKEAVNERESDLKRMIDAQEAFELIDIRTPAEVDQARIEGATLLDEAAYEQLLELPRETRLVFICHHGPRGENAARQFVSEGFTDVHNVVGGIDAWSQEIDPEVPRY